MRAIFFALIFLAESAIGDNCAVGRRTDYPIPIDMDSTILETATLSLCDLSSSALVDNINVDLKNIHSVAVRNDLNVKYARTKSDFYNEIRQQFEKVYRSGSWLVIEKAYIVGEFIYLVIKTNSNQKFTYLKFPYIDNNLILGEVFEYRGPVGVFLLSLDQPRSKRQSFTGVKLFSSNPLYLDVQTEELSSGSVLISKQLAAMTKLIDEKNFKDFLSYFGTRSQEKLSSWLEEMPSEEVKADSLKHYVVPSGIKKVVKVGDVRIYVMTESGEPSGRLYFHDGKFYNLFKETYFDNVLWLIVRDRT